MRSSVVKLAVFGGSMGTLGLSKTVLNDQKRRFYEDLEEDVIPGTNTLLTEAQKKDILGLETSLSTLNKSVTPEGMTVSLLSYLERHLQDFRKRAVGYFDHYFYEYQTAKLSAKNELEAVKAKYNNVIVEPVLPGLIYTLTAALSGLVLAGRRGFLVRFASPAVFGVAAFGYCMPQSFANVRAELWALEKKHFPQVARKHLESLIQAEKTKKSVCEGVTEAEKSLTEYVGCARRAIVEFFD